MTTPTRTWNTEDIAAAAEPIRDWLDDNDSDISHLLFNSDVEAIAMAVWPIIEGRSRERIAAYLDRVADRHRRTGLPGDVMTGNQLAEAAGWCRDETIWDQDRD